MVVDPNPGYAFAAGFDRVVRRHSDRSVYLPVVLKGAQRKTGWITFGDVMVKKTNRKTNLGKWVWTFAVVLTNLVLWGTPSDLAYNVAQQRDILLGRYTVDRVTMLLIVLIISALILNGIWLKRKREGKKEKEHKFKVIAVSVSIIISIVAVDVYLRIVQNRNYVRSPGFYHRVTNTVQHGVNRDVPLNLFSYPQARPGYPDVDYTLTTDDRGFRNSTDLEKYDIVVLGDSFTEGSQVSDNQTWPVLLAAKSTRTVYNLGMAAGNPATYLETLKKFGVGLSPQIVICMLYEGNDFRVSNFDTSDEDPSPFNPRALFYSSPLRLRARQALLRYLGPIDRNRFKNTGTGPGGAQPYAPSHPLYAVSWMPVGVPTGPDAKYYTFTVKRLLDHFVSSDTFLNSPACRQTLETFRVIKRICEENNIRFIIAYAPDKPHVLLPLIKHTLSPDMLHAFMALKEKDLPPVEKLMEVLMTRLGVQESAVEAFCREEKIGFISLTEPLQQSMTKGLQAYYTYDQHWTPDGHEVVAEALCRYLQNSIEGK